MNSLQEKDFLKKIQKIDDGKRLLLLLHYNSMFKKSEFAKKIDISQATNLTRLYDKEIFDDDLLIKIINIFKISKDEWYNIGRTAPVAAKSVEDALIQYAALSSYFLNEIDALKRENQTLKNKP